jgi:hypothetical protein
MIVGKYLVVVTRIDSEKLERFDEGAAPGDDLGAARGGLGDGGQDDARSRWS